MKKYEHQCPRTNAVRVLKTVLRYYLTVSGVIYEWMSLNGVISLHRYLTELFVFVNV